MTTGGPFRFFDAHVHFWDPANVDWYPHLQPGFDLSESGLGTADGMKRRYGPDAYRADALAAGIEVVGLVHVDAVRGEGRFIAEGEWLDGVHDTDGLPNAIIGSFDRDEPLAAIEQQLDDQGKVSLFRGVRSMAPLDYASTHGADILRALAERDLVYDIVAHPGEMGAAARAVAERPDATYVLEHTGWPLVGDDGERAVWEDDIRELAAASANIHCKLSGLPMTTHTFDVAVLRPWIEFCLQEFGVDRCFFGSNFPVDALFGDLGGLLASYREITASLGAEAQQKLFVDNASRVYRAVP